MNFWPLAQQMVPYCFPAQSPDCKSPFPLIPSRLDSVFGYFPLQLGTSVRRVCIAMQSRDDTWMWNKQGVGAMVYLLLSLKVVVRLRDHGVVFCGVVSLLAGFQKWLGFTLVTHWVTALTSQLVGYSLLTSRFLDWTWNGSQVDTKKYLVPVNTTRQGKP